MSKSEPASTSDFFNKLPKSRQHIISLAILFVIPLILFFETTLGGMELQRHDITQWRAGVESIEEHREEFGEDPLWSVNMFLGMPAYVISVQTVVPHLDRIAGKFQRIYPAFQYWVMLFGMYFFLTLLGFSPLASVTGALMFGLTTYFPVIILAGHTNKFFALALAPWLIAGYWLLSRSDKKLPGLLLFMVALTLQLRAGHPQITYYFFYLLGILWAFDTWNAYKEKKLNAWAIVTVLLVAGGVVGILGTAEKLLPLREYAHYSMRGGSAITGTESLDQSYAFSWSQGISETLTLIVPDLFGGASPNYWGPKSVTSGPHYLGVITFLLILVALFRVRKKTMFIFFGTGTLGILFAWGGHFEAFNALAFKYIPYFSKFRAPETWLVLPAFCYSIVAIYGLNWLIEAAKDKAPSLKKLYAPVGAAGAVLILLFIGLNSMDYYKTVEVDQIAAQIAQQNQVSPNHPQVQAQAQNYVQTRLVPDREENAKADVLRFGLFLILAGGVFYVTITAKIPASASILSIILLVSIDMIGVDKRYMPEQNFVPGNVDPERTILSQKRDIDSFIEERIVDESGFPYRVLPLSDGVFSNNIPTYFYPTVGGYTGAKLGVTQDVLMADNNPLFAGPVGINIDLLALLNTKYLIYGQGLNFPELTPVFQSQSGVVYELNSVLPKAFFVDSVINAQTPNEAYDLLYPGQLDFATTAVVENFDATTGPDSASVAEVTFYEANKINIRTSRSTPGYLVISEIYYPAGWTATLDGEPVEIHKANYLLRGIQVPAGEHTIELTFRPKTHALGVTLSWISLAIQVLFAAFVGFIFLKKRTKMNETK